MDTETSGLDSTKHQILTMGMVITDYEFNILFEKEYLIKQEPWAIIEDKALNINKINLEEHNKIAKSSYDSGYELKKDLLNYLGKNSWIQPIGHNFAFDDKFIRALYSKVDILICPFHYHFEDTMILANVLRNNGMLDVPNVKLETLSKHFGYSAKFHNSLEDAKATIHVYKHLVNIIKKGLYYGL